MSTIASTPAPPTRLNLGNVTGGKHPWTGGEPVNATYTGTLQSAHCYHIQEMTEVNKQMKMKTMILT